MFEERIKEYYDALTPSEETKNALVVKVKATKKRRALLRLVYRSIGSAAACFLLALGVNLLRAPRPEVGNLTLGTVISEPNGYLVGGMLLVLLLVLFAVLCVKSIKEK